MDICISARFVGIDKRNATRSFNISKIQKLNKKKKNSTKIMLPYRYVPGFGIEFHNYNALV